MPRAFAVLLLITNSKAIGAAPRAVKNVRRFIGFDARDSAAADAACPAHFLDTP